MKKTDLEKLKGKKITGAGYGTPERFGRGAATEAERKAQRQREREQGLVPFACKLPAELAREVRELAERRGEGLNEITAELLRQGLGAK